MNVYEITTSDSRVLGGKAEFIHLNPKRTDRKHLDPLRKGLPVSTWKPLVLAPFNKRGKPCDAMWCGLELIFKERIYASACKSYLENSGQLLPVEVPALKGNHAIFHCTNLLDDVLDLERSVFDWHDDCPVFLVAPVFREEKLPRTGLFKFPKYGLTRAFCVEDDAGVGFKRTFCDLEFRGIGFDLVWTSGEAPIIPDHYRGASYDLRTGAGKRM